MMHAWKKLQSFPLLKTLPQLSILLAKCLLGLFSHFLFFCHYVSEYCHLSAQDLAETTEAWASHLSVQGLYLTPGLC